MVLSTEFFQTNVTEYSEKFCTVVNKTMLWPHQNQLVSELQGIYEFHKSRWNKNHGTCVQAHRLLIQSCIAYKLLDRSKFWEIHTELLQWIAASDCHCCAAHSHDFHNHDSLNALIFGLQAWIQACLYLKPFTKYDYKKCIVPIMDFLHPYLVKRKFHTEFLQSRYESDFAQPDYGKVFDPAWATDLIEIYQKI